MEDEKSRLRRWMTIIAGIVFAALGIWGVHPYRDGSLPVREVVLVWWYLAASGPAVIALLCGLAFSSKRHCWSKNGLANLLLITMILSQICIPAMYVLYFKDAS